MFNNFSKVIEKYFYFGFLCSLQPGFLFNFYWNSAKFYEVPKKHGIAEIVSRNKIDKLFAKKATRDEKYKPQYSGKNFRSKFNGNIFRV